MASYAIAAWLVGLYSDDVQGEVFVNPDVRVSGVLAPTGTVTPVEGGFVLTGQWPFATGALNSQWISLAAQAPLPDGGGQPIMIMVPARELEIVDDWNPAGLRGTGSVTLTAEALFVPARRAMPMTPILHEQHANRLNADRPVYRTPIFPTRAAAMAGTMVGIARAALDLYVERLRECGGTETTDVAPGPYLRIAEAALRIDEAEFHARPVAEALDLKAWRGEKWQAPEKVRAQAGLTRAFQLVNEAARIISLAVAASPLRTPVPVQRHRHDVQTLSLYADHNPDATFETYGRVLCGMDPRATSP